MQELERLVKESFTDEFLRGSLALLYGAYRGAMEECRERFSPEIAHDTRPHIQRARFEETWRELAERTSDVHARIASNPRKTSYYTEVRGGRVVLTQSAVLTPGSQARDARFRSNLSFMNQELLFSDRTDTEAADAYGILVHGPIESHPGLPAFAGVGFPAPGLGSYVWYLDLFDAFPETVRQYTPEEVVEDMAWPKLRPRITHRESREGMDS